MRQTRRQFGRLVLSGLPAVAVQRRRDDGMRLALRPGRTAPVVSLDRALDWAAALDVHHLQLDHRQIETYLGAPLVPLAVSADRAQGLEQGLLDLEEDILREAADLERASRIEALRGWRRRISLRPLQDFRARASRRGIQVVSISWDGVAHLPDDELEYAWRVTRGVGATILTTTFALAGAARLAAAASRGGVRLALHATAPADMALLPQALALERTVGVAFDLAAWAASGGGSPLTFLTTHLPRVAQIDLTDWRTRDGRRVRLGSGDASVGDVVKTARDRQWPTPLVLTASDEPGTDAPEHLEADRAFCAAVLLSS